MLHPAMWCWVRRKEGMKAGGGGCTLTGVYWSHPPPSSSQLRAQNGKEANDYLPNSTNFLNLILQKSVLLSVCEYSCLEFICVNSETDVTCKAMKQDYLVITYFATGPSCLAICCSFLWKKSEQNLIRPTENNCKFSMCICRDRKRLL